MDDLVLGYPTCPGFRRCFCPCPAPASHVPFPDGLHIAQSCNGPAGMVCSAELALLVPNTHTRTHTPTPTHHSYAATQLLHTLYTTATSVVTCFPPLGFVPQLRTGYSPPSLKLLPDLNSGGSRELGILSSLWPWLLPRPHRKPWCADMTLN